MKESKEWHQTLFDTFTLRNLLQRTRENFLRPDWDTFFTRLYLIGMFFLILSVFGLLLVLVMLPISQKGGPINTIESFYSDLYTPLVALVFVFSFIMPPMVKAINGGDLNQLVKILEGRFTSLGSGWWGGHHILTGLTNYAIGAVLFWTALVFRGVTRSLTIGFDVWVHPLKSILLLLAILLLDFGYIGLLFVSLSQLYEGYRSLLYRSRLGEIGKASASERE